MQNAAANNSEFTHVLRDWRKIRKMSQLDLSLEADVSQRHLSWLETGRAKPSREMVVRLAETLSIPNRDRNRLLSLAGFAPLYVESELDQPVMQTVSNVLEMMLENHNPYPAIVMDRQWNLKMKNSAADKLLSAFGDMQQLLENTEDDGRFNIARLSLHPKGLCQFIKNWDEIAAGFYMRLRREAYELHDAAAIELIEELKDFVDLEHTETFSTEPLAPVMPLQYMIGDQEISIVSVLSTFGSAQDVTANELRIETFYPTDEISAAYFRQQ